MCAQSTLISYHTEAFVKTEVGCTVVNNEVRKSVSRPKNVKQEKM